MIDVMTGRRATIVALLALTFAIAMPRAAQAAVKAKVSTALNLNALTAGQQAVMAVVVDVPPGLHAQSHTPTESFYIPFEVKINPNPQVEVFAPIYPPGEARTYPALGALSVYTGRVVVYIPMQVKAGVAPGKITLSGKLIYQMCDDRACYPPQKPEIELATTILPPGSALTPSEPELFKGFDSSQFARLSAAPVPQVKLFGIELKQGAYAFPFLAALIIGVIFNIMPCVLPVVPLKAMSFYEVSQHNRARSLLLGIVFSLGIIAVFATLGLLVVVLRKFAWGQLFGYAWFLGLIVAILVVLALQLFGAFSVVLPQGVYRFAPRHDSFGGNFLFGIFTAILSTPCTFGLFLALLIWATAQPAAIGLALLVTVGLGMGLPYLILSATPELARRFPRTGPWAELVKQLMGFLLLASAVFFARRFIVEWSGDKAFWWILFGVIAAAGLFLVVRTVQFSLKTWSRAIATVLALAFVVPAFAFTWRQTHPPIDWQPYSANRVAAARAGGRIVVLEFTAAWCGNCIGLETTVFHDPRTVRAFKQHNVLPVRVDLTRDDAPGWKTLSGISAVGAIPFTAVFGPGGKEPIQLTGLYGTGDLVAALDRAASPAGAMARE